MKQTIIHIIFNLERGGAETMLVTVVKELKEYNNIVVTLFEGNHFSADEFVCDRHIDMGLRSVVQLPAALFRLRKIIRQCKPHIVHTHLFWPTVLARLATPRRIPLVTTIHAFVAQLVDYKIWYLKLLDKLSYRMHKSHIIAVAKGALEEYFSFLKLKPYKAWHLYTFVDDKRFVLPEAPPLAMPAEATFKIISVGALRIQKNQSYLIQAMALLKNHPIELHIYGRGPLQPDLEQQIKATGAHVVLKGQVSNIQEVIPQYDLFAMSSTYEGFSLAVLEAMAMEKPLLLSHIPSFTEQCEDTAQYFDLTNPADFAEKAMSLAQNKAQMAQMAAAGKQRALQNFTLAQHLEGLRRIYQKVLEGS